MLILCAKYPILNCNLHCEKALAVKVFSAMPVSMVDEWAMSVVTWLNSPKRRQQKVKTVADHLIICGFDQLHKKVSFITKHTRITESTVSQKPFQKLVTVNWQDIHATIQQNPQTVSTMSKNNYDEENEVSDNEELNSPVDPTHDHYKWLDDGLQGGTRIWKV